MGELLVSDPEEAHTYTESFSGFQRKRFSLNGKKGSLSRQACFSSVFLYYIPFPFPSSSSS